MRLDPKYVEMEREMAVRGAVEWMDNVVDVFERAGREAASYRARFLEAVVETNAGKKDASKPSEVLSWLVNSTCNPAANLRLDMAVTHGARVSEAYRKVKELRERTAADEASERVSKATFMLTGVRTVLPTLRSARAYCDNARPPLLIHVGTVETCFERAKKLNGGRMNCTIEEWHANHVPVVVTDDWTYHVSSMVTPDEYEY